MPFFSLMQQQQQQQTTRDQSYECIQRETRYFIKVIKDVEQFTLGMDIVYSSRKKSKCTLIQIQHLAFMYLDMNNNNNNNKLKWTTTQDTVNKPKSSSLLHHHTLQLVWVQLVCKDMLLFVSDICGGLELANLHCAFIFYFERLRFLLETLQNMPHLSNLYPIVIWSCRDVPSQEVVLNVFHL